MTWVLAVLPAGLLLLGFPIFLILLTAASVALVLYMDIPLVAVHQVMFGGVDKFALLAVPFFIFAGEIMGQGGISRRIVEWVLAMFGRVPGSLGLTTVGTCTVLGAMSGSSPATVAATSRLLYPTLRRNGYGESFAAALITSSGSIAIVIPPSIAMILYGAVAEQSIPKLFAGGIVPGLVIAALICGYVVLYARARGIRETSHFSWRVLAQATGRGVWALGTPVIILGGIYAGVFSPTEAAGIACVYAAVVTRLIYREISWRKLWEIAADSVFLTAQIMIIVAAAGVFSWVLTVSGIPQSLVALIGGLDLSPWMVLLVINVFLLLVGCVIDPLSAILVLTPLLVPIVEPFGVDLVHFGIIITVNLSIGMFTPPFGLNIFVAQAMINTPLGVLYRGLLPFIALQIAALLAITYLPALTLIPAGFIG